jgi:hypothetical protein
VLPGLRVNLSKSGASLSVGVRGAHLTLGKRSRVTVGLPGSGLSWTQSLGHIHPSEPPVEHVCTLETGCNPAWVPVGRAMPYVVVLLALGLLLWWWVK